MGVSPVNALREGELKDRISAGQQPYQGCILADLALGKNIIQSFNKEVFSLCFHFTTLQGPIFLLW